MHFTLILLFFIQFCTSAFAYSNSNRDCKGILPGCTCDERVIDCSNAGFNTTEIFINIPTYFPDLISLNMTGNKLEYLERDLFSLRGGEWPALEKLDLSNCGIVGIHMNAFLGLPKLEELILSKNSLSFRGRESKIPGHRIWPTENFLRVISSNLKILELSDAFNRKERKEAPTAFVANLTKLFNETDLKDLQYLNLSSNHLPYLPSDAFCRAPVLEYLYLGSNRIFQFTIDPGCLPTLIELHLQSNFFRRIDDTFMDFMQNQPILRKVYLAGNPFTCDCQSEKFIRWARFNGKLMDKNQFVCAKSIPKEFADRPLISVPEEKLRCANDASEYLHGVYILCAIAFVGLIALLTCVIYTNRRILCNRSRRSWMPLGGYHALGKEPEVKAEMV